MLEIKDKQQFYQYLDALPIAIALAEVDTHVLIYFNPKAEQLWQRSAQEVIGQKQTVLHSDYWNKQGIDTFSKNIEALNNGKTLENIANAALRPDGSEIPIEINSNILSIEGKKTLIGVFQSVEKQVQAYQQLKLRESEFYAIFSNSQMGIIHLKGGRFLYHANQRLVDILGYDSIDEMLGISMEQLHLSQERFLWFGKEHYESLQNKDVIHVQYQLRKKNGEPIWVSLNGKAIDKSIPANLDLGVIWMLDDISDYKNMQESLQKENDKVRQFYENSQKERKRLEFLMENVNGISWEYDLQADKFTYVSPNAERILGYKSNKWTDLDSWANMIHPDDRERITAYCALETEKGHNHFMEYKMIKSDGSIIWVFDIITLNKNQYQQASKLYGIILDITEQKTAQLKIEADRNYLCSIVNGVTDPIMVIKSDYSVELMNKKIQANLKNYQLADPDNPKCYEVSHFITTPCDSADHPCPLHLVLETKTQAKVIHNHKDSSGADHFVELAASPLFDDDGNCTGIIESARDITAHLKTLDELRNKSDLLDFQAHHDALTHLPNRTLFYDRLEQGIEKARRSKKKLAVFFIDLDHFKQINDSLGHLVGDKILIEASKRLKAHLRSQDTLARLGGDEFIILLEEINKVQDASVLAQKILELFKQPFHIEEHEHALYLSCSIGIALYPDDDYSPENLLKFSDNAMYKAKEEGRNNFQFYAQEMTELAFERIILEASLRQAITNNDFCLYYQPQYDGIAKKIIGMEALIRWQHATLGIIPPSKFIPLAEETGLIIKIDNWVMLQAMTQFSQWYKDGLNPGTLSLNLAIKQLESPVFFTQLEKTLQQTQFNPQWLKLEVLERDVMCKPNESILKLEKIRQLGIQLAIDDFGTGQSSLTYLKRFPINQLKIDQSFVHDINVDEEGKAIVLAVIALANALNIEVLAEGVETIEQLEFLLKNNCQYIQGYYFSRPVTAEDLQQLLSDKLTES